MRYHHGLLLAAICCIALSGCNAKALEALEAKLNMLEQKLAKLNMLEQENVSLKAQVQAAENKTAQTQQELVQLNQQITNYQEIEKGYEQARVKIKDQMEAQMKVLAPLLGLSVDLTSSLPLLSLPNFEELKNSDWVDKLAPSAGGGADLSKNALKELENIKEIKGIEAELIKEILGDGKDKKEKPQPNKPQPK